LSEDFFGKKSSWIVCLLGVMLTSQWADAASFRPSFAAGLMVPPSSQYYHYVYGAQVDLARKFDQSLVRIQYLQRPKFTSHGYLDQDFSGLVLVGQSIFRHKNLGVTSLVGGGYAWGYIKSTEGAPEQNSYKLPGLAVAIEGRWSPKLMDIRLAHQVLIAHGSTEQLNAYVTWPFNWFVLSISRPIQI
jgi:hypothetical protein